ncbi:MAG TPA: MFS transporter [Gammaproteobacteria bacterium]
MTTQHMKRNVALLALGQAVMMSGGVLLVATGSLLGKRLAEQPLLATLPVALQMVASVAMAIPASFLMARIGRRAGFMLGALLAIVGGALATYGIVSESFLLFSLAAVLLGVFTGFGNYFRFAAVDAATVDYRARAVSYVMAGGVIAAVLGPNLASWGAGLLPGIEFAGGYILLTLLYVVVFLALAALDIPSPPAFSVAGRSLGAIAQQARFVVAVIGGAGGFAIMALVMTATPLAMADCGYPYPQTSFVIEWHVLGMFVPSFFTGRLIQRFGVFSVMMTGAVLYLFTIAINLNGITVSHFWSALLLLGVGWNFLFIGATQLLTTAYRPEEQAKVQAANDFLVFGITALAVLFAGKLQIELGWRMVNLGVAPAVVLVIGALLWLRWSMEKEKEVAERSVT